MEEKTKRRTEVFVQNEKRETNGSPFFVGSWWFSVDEWLIRIFIFAA
jgi:hypothetical protein